MQTRGEGNKKNPKIKQISFMNGPRSPSSLIKQRGSQCEGKMASCSSPPPPQLADHNTRTGLVFSVRGPIPIQLGRRIGRSRLLVICNGDFVPPCPVRICELISNMKPPLLSLLFGKTPHHPGTKRQIGSAIRAKNSRPD